jgi:hypothetical protein
MDKVIDFVDNLDKVQTKPPFFKILDLVHLDKVTAWGIDRVDGFVDIL